jgi:hypothetical protein
MAKLRKPLKKFNLRMAKDQRPLIIDPDLINLFRDCGERSGKAIALSIIVQRIAHLAAETKSLDLSMQDYFDLFPFVDSRYLRRSLYILRKYKIWKNDMYRPHTNMAAYTNIRICWPAVARLAKKIQKEQS